MARFLSYIGCDSESGCERAFCERMEQELHDLGLTTGRDEIGEACGSDGFNVRAFLPASEGYTASEPILFSAHLDTVTPGRGIRPVVKDGIVRSSGDTILGADDKSGVAAVMEALQSIVESGAQHRRVEILFSICEETGLLGSKHADYSQFQSKQAVVLDSSSRAAIVNRAPATVRMHVQITGKSAHAAAAPEKGAHALKAAAAAINEIPCGYVGSDSVMNVGTISCEGRTNIVPASCRFDMEIRSFCEERLNELIEQTRASIDAACKRFGASFELELRRTSGVLYVPEDSPVVQALLGAYDQLGICGQIKATFGGCDATWLFANGIGAVNIGTGMQSVHGTDEHIAVEDMVDTAQVVRHLILH